MKGVCEECFKPLADKQVEQGQLDACFLSRVTARVFKGFKQTAADVNEIKNAKVMCLIRAAINGHDTCVAGLIKAGADVNKTDQYGANALMRAAYGYDKCVDVLIRAGAHGITSLMQTAMNGSEKCIDILVRAGADVNARSKNGFTACMKTTKVWKH